MWLMTRYGFFSIVEKPADREAGTLTVRARVRADLDALREHALPGLGPIVEHAGSDYRFRARAARSDVAAALAALVDGLDYPNFKDEVARRQGTARAAAYGRVWDALYDLQADASAHAERAGGRDASARDRGPSVPSVRAAAPSRPSAWGGVLLDAQRRVLLRRPKGDYDGYAWTFPKGRPDPGETPEAAALREVREETGWEAAITGRLEGSFAGGTSVTGYFLMRPVTEHGDFDRAETSAVRWATPAQADRLIRQTTNAAGRTRDLAVLAAAVRYAGG